MLCPIQLTQTQVAAEHMQDPLTALPFIATAVTRAPLGHFCAAVAHVVGGHDGAWLLTEESSVTCIQLDKQLTHLYSKQIDLAVDRCRYTK